MLIVCNVKCLCHYYQDEPSSVAESVRQAAQDAVLFSGFVYDENSGMYYDHNSGYYYDSVSFNKYKCALNM